MSETNIEVFTSFLTDIVNVFPEYKERLYDYYLIDESETVSESDDKEIVDVSNDIVDVTDDIESEVKNLEGQEDKKDDGEDEVRDVEEVKEKDEDDEDVKENDEDDGDVKEDDEDDEDVKEDDEDDEDEQLIRFEEFLQNVYKHRVMIADRDESLFEKDPVFLNNVSFKLLWKSDISVKTKQSIWKYLQTFCILKITNESNDEIKGVMKCLEENIKVKDKKTVKEMKTLQKLNDSIHSENESTEETPEELKGIEDVFKNTKIGQMAEDITKKLDIESMMGGGEEGGGGIEDFFKGDNLTNIFKTISETINVDGGDQNDLLSEATNICNNMQGNPLFSSLLGMQNNLMKEMQGSMDNEHTYNMDESVKQISVSETSHSGKSKKKQKQLNRKHNQGSLTIEKQS
jgi:hypothetical protein